MQSPDAFARPYQRPKTSDGVDMMKIIHTFQNDEDGAVTVDWVVLTAAIILTAISAFVVIKQSSDDMGASVGAYLTAKDQAELRNPTP